MKLLVGLGNPGTKYAKTRHNVGFMAVDELARSLGLEWREKFNGEWAKGSIGGEDIVLLKPMTFMNDSGRSVQAAAAFFHLKAAPNEMLVLHDELDIPFGEVRLKVGGGHAGHNGLRSIVAALGAEFARVRMGIGRPPAGYRGEVADFVLTPFEAVEAASVPDLVNKACDAAKKWIDKGALAANDTNVRRKKA
jgi:peptidyl-tRNA hydrolase, PTH1 family